MFGTEEACGGCEEDIIAAAAAAAAAVLALLLLLLEVLIYSYAVVADLGFGSGMSNISYMDISLIVSTSASSFTTSSISFRMSSIYLG